MYSHSYYIVILVCTFTDLVSSKLHRIKTGVMLCSVTKLSETDDIQGFPMTYNPMKEYCRKKSKGSDDAIIDIICFDIPQLNALKI